MNTYIYTVMIYQYWTTCVHQEFFLKIVLKTIVSLQSRVSSKKEKTKQDVGVIFSSLHAVCLKYLLYM